MPHASVVIPSEPARQCGRRGTSPAKRVAGLATSLVDEIPRRRDCASVRMTNIGRDCASVGITDLAVLTQPLYREPPGSAISQV
jgi:hypothetical protein